jgi:hypothetical protein
MTEKVGGHYPKINRLILPYPGRELLPGSLFNFFTSKSGISERYIYDLGLSTGEVLYSCKGGVGISTEPYLTNMHGLINMPYAETLVNEEFKNTFEDKWNLRKFNKLKQKVNRELKNPSRRTMAGLYCLLYATGFRHKFDSFGNFKGEYFPHPLVNGKILINNTPQINSSFIFINSSRKKFMRRYSHLLTSSSLLHYHLPFPSSKIHKRRIFNFFNSAHRYGYDFLLTSRLVNMGKLDSDLVGFSKNYSTYTFLKDPGKYESSDVFITNF